METWDKPSVPELPGQPPTLRLYDSATGQLVDLTNDSLRMWMCGITPYDATHFGHANTYVAFDTLSRVWRDGGRELVTASNVTDMDDPLFERAAQTGQDWYELALTQTQLFRDDMVALRVLPPDTWTAVTEILDPLEELVRKMEQDGYAYRVPAEDGSEFVYADIAADSQFLSAPVFADMDVKALFDARGGDSWRPGKRNELDPQLWKGVVGDDYRPAGGQPGDWRPGWHIECALMAHQNLGEVDVHAGGKDLIFPHHEMAEHHMRQLNPNGQEVTVHAHAAMVAYEGEKMSKSLGNLVFVSKLRHSGVDPRVIRLAILAQHYRIDWEYEDAALDHAAERLREWQAGIDAPVGDDDHGQRSSEAVLARIREALSHDLDTPQALKLMDDHLRGRKSWDSKADRDLARDTIDALFGINL
ncbi:hypothetical protein [Trueperella bialowiezensis]|uniref:L-cysteine:1D-myo-inositol 2-amino-2-deoxy-alpha-D-glucopyranoside ligase n=1 Tax=Trueperella bialowiezensis TaxID=312285 RepID=A0A3S4X4B6_9ACTO|nr:hypothetical protein [Trueperella bialowiezensis]VEI12373.1 L-cysteine:1D-myo-inositol 2-amino-2-deoxy-alpha-D-glucopyranoside ligase [Trueperella bialowiezensis]